MINEQQNLEWAVGRIRELEETIKKMDINRIYEARTQDDVVNEHRAVFELVAKFICFPPDGNQEAKWKLRHEIIMGFRDIQFCEDCFQWCDGSCRENE
jgi:hypothetical protein